MARPLSNGLRERLVRAASGGMSGNAAVARFQVSAGAVVKLMQRWNKTGDFKPGASGGYHGHRLSAHQRVIEELMEEHNDLTLKEIQEQLRQPARP